jgi:hypothetical protein
MCPVSLMSAAAKLQNGAGRLPPSSVTVTSTGVVQAATTIVETMT